MAVVTWSSAARQDVAAIRDYYGERSPEHARKVITRVFGAVSQLEAFPHMGRQVPEIESEMFRELIVESYLVVEEASVEVLAVAHSKQDLARKLSRRS